VGQALLPAALEPAIASLGVPYRFQHPVWALGVFPDFVLLQHRLVIEVDDDSHRRASKKKADAERTAKLERAGWRVVRCTNAEALSYPYQTIDRLMADAGLELRTVRED
jgi:very-short-patch-repair endonuclease